LYDDVVPASILQTIQAVTIPAGNVLVLAHGLRNGLIGLKPNVVQPDRDTPLVVTGADDTNVSYSNPDVDAHTANFLVQSDHSIQQAFPTSPLEFYYQGGGTGGAAATEQRFRYTATGAEGSDFFVPLPAARANDSYIITAALVNASTIYGFRFPDASIPDRKTTEFRMITTVALTAVDAFDFRVIDS
jgi:hypothetical protein